MSARIFSLPLPQAAESVLADLVTEDLPKRASPWERCHGDGEDLQYRCRLSARWPQERSAVGRLGEHLAADLAAHLGCDVLDRNWRNRYGELDLVVRAPRGSIRIVEVRARSSHHGRGLARESVTATKARRLRRMSGLWLAHRCPEAAEVAVDLVAVECLGQLGTDPNSDAVALEWLRDVA